MVEQEKREEKITTVERPLMPFTWTVPDGGFVSPQTVRFTLTPFVSAKRFSCNLMSGGEHFFHFRVDFHNANEKSSKEAVVRNSTRGYKWQTEERHVTTFPFSKGITSDILFVAYGSTVAVDVDGSPYVKFAYRNGDNPAQIDRITVEGDCVLQRFVHKA
ncbi:galactoside-binding lectin [Ostertagia ostertagi]